VPIPFTFTSCLSVAVLTLTLEVVEVAGFFVEGGVDVPLGVGVGDISLPGVVGDIPPPEEGGVISPLGVGEGDMSLLGEGLGVGDRSLLGEGDIPPLGVGDMSLLGEGDASLLGAAGDIPPLGTGSDMPPGTLVGDWLGIWAITAKGKAAPIEQHRARIIFWGVMTHFLSLNMDRSLKLDLAMQTSSYADLSPSDSIVVEVVPNLPRNKISRSSKCLILK
jgi:hypothetical protein